MLPKKVSLCLRFATTIVGHFHLARKMNEYVRYRRHKFVNSSSPDENNGEISRRQAHVGLMDPVL